jgi:hypothetical protein
VSQEKFLDAAVKACHGSEYGKLAVGHQYRTAVSLERLGFGVLHTQDVNVGYFVTKR